MAATLVFEEFLTDLIDATTYTFSGADIGPAASDRIVVVTCHTESAIAALSSATIGGSAADIHVQSNNGNVVTSIISLLVTTGTTADIVLTWDQETFRCIIGVWSLTGADATPVATDTDGAASGTGLSLTVTIPAEGTAVSGDTHGSQATTTTWGGATVRFNDSPDSASHMSGADTPSTGSLRTDHNITTSHANSTQPIAAAVVVWEQAAAGETATGAPDLPLPTASGAAEVINTATGAPVLAIITAAGTSEVIKPATGAPSIAVIEADGTAANLGKLANGAPVMPVPTAAGAAQVINTATGAPDMPVPIAAGVCEVINTATGAPVLTLVTASGDSFVCTESLAPDTIAAIVNLSGAVTDIDEPVNTPDGNWLLQA